jgi:ribulose-5-phosphate 4-epimerase/fuculose-1-phosphate aldolase
MTSHSVREDLARACRVLARHEMIDLWGHLSLRIPKSDLVLVTPAFSKDVLPRTIRAEDLLVCDPDGNRVDGRGELPRQFPVDLALYRHSGASRAVIFAAPRYAMAAAMAGYVLKPLTHMESDTGFGVRTFTGDRLGDPSLAEALGQATAVHQPGVGTWAAGSDVFEALARMYHLEYLAQANSVVAGDSSMNTIAREDSDKLWRQFAGHAHYREFWESLDPGPLAPPYDAFVAQYESEAPHQALKCALAFSCRMLWERDTLVAFLEHISHRLPGNQRFLMTASRNFGQIEPGDCCLLDFDANWIDGPRPPGFKWFHAQLLRERQDVQAVVHTHDLYGRTYALSQRTLAPGYRVGLDIATRRMPMYSRCDLIVDPEVRRQTLDALATGPVVHEIGHGTDFVSDNLERATVDAIQREAFLAMDGLARRFGGARAMPERLVEEVRRQDPGAEHWWAFYAAEVGAPRRSVAGLGNR